MKDQLYCKDEKCPNNGLFNQQKVLSLVAIQQGVPAEHQVFDGCSSGERTLLATTGSNQFFLDSTAKFCCWNFKI